ncbi:MAG: CHAD domain-containing protein [Acidimicrobiales bacterium]
MSRSASPEHFVAQLLSRETAALLRSSAVARTSRDPEGVHQARVATRRLRADVSLLAGMLDPPWRARLVHELGHFGRLLGRCRDLDVVIARLDTTAGDDPTLDITVIVHLRARRDALTPRLDAAIDSHRYRKMLNYLVDGSLSPPLAPSPPDWCSPLVERWRRRWDAVATAMELTPTSEQLHALRIATKRARYASEVVDALVGKLQPVLDRATAAQDHLGLLHDQTVTSALVAEWYHSPAAAQGVDPNDAIESWARALQTDAPHAHRWLDPLTEALVLVEERSRHLPGSRERTSG